MIRIRVRMTHLVSYISWNAFSRKLLLRLNVRGADIFADEIKRVIDTIVGNANSKKNTPWNSRTSCKMQKRTTI